MADNLKVYAMSQTKEPYKSYRKAIVGKVYVTIIDKYENKPLGVILEGNGEDSIVDTWDEREDVFFRKANRPHLESGTILPYIRTYEKIISEEEKYNTLSDDELVELLNSKFLSLQSAANKMTKSAPLFRLLQTAKDLEKSEKIIKFIEGKLAAVQLEE